MAGRNSTGRQLKGSRLLGLRELDEALAEIAQVYGPKRGQKVMTQALRAATRPVVVSAKAKIPTGDAPHWAFLKWPDDRRRVFGGFAKRSIKAVVRKRASGSGRWRAYVGVSRWAFYAVQWVELGSSKQAPKPWLVPAMEQNQQAMIQALRKKMSAAVTKLLKDRRK